MPYKLRSSSIPTTGYDVRHPMTRPIDYIRLLRKYLPYTLLLLWFILHLPFLNADPDTLADIHTRGAWTDEGLYTAQARNIINTGTVAWKEDSLLTRGPLFVITQLPFFLLFGQSLWVARFIILLFTITTFVIFFKNPQTKMTGLFFLLIGFTQFHLFQFSHYAMSEIAATCMIVLAILMMATSLSDDLEYRKRRKKIWISGALLFIAYGLKIQFLYIAFLLPFFLFVSLVIKSIVRKKIYREGWRLVWTSGLITLTFMLVYFLLWYLPNQEFYHYVMSREVDSRFPSTLKDIIGQTTFNFRELILVAPLKPLVISGGLSVAGGGLWLLFKPSAWRTPERFLFIAGILWLLLEVHKVSMTYMPHRYLLSAYAALGLTTASVISTVFHQKRFLSGVAIMAVIVMAAWQLTFTYQALERRSFELRTVNQYLRQYPWKGETITGAWAGSVAWGTGARTYPVWFGFLNDDKALDGKMIIAETDQEDSDRSLHLQGKNLSELSDSVRTFKVWRYHIDLFWLKKP